MILKKFSFLKDKKIHNLIYSAAGGSILLYNFISRIKLDNKVNLLNEVRL